MGQQMLRERKWREEEEEEEEKQQAVQTASSAVWAGKIETSGRK